MDYRKGKKAGCVTCARDRNVLRNTGHTAIALTQVILLMDAVGLEIKKTHPRFTRISCI